MSLILNIKWFYEREDNLMDIFPTSDISVSFFLCFDTPISSLK